jgi:hypothetical protein
MMVIDVIAFWWGGAMVLFINIHPCPRHFEYAGFSPTGLPPPYRRGVGDDHPNHLNTIAPPL